MDLFLEIFSIALQFFALELHLILFLLNLSFKLLVAVF